MSENPNSKAIDRKTGEKGDLDVWPDDIGLNPAPVWDGKPAVFTHVTHVSLLSHIEAGDELVILGNDRAVACSVTDVDADDSDQEQL